MKLTTLGIIIGLIISISWVAWGFFPMLAILLSTIILGGCGYFLDAKGYSINKLAIKMLDKLAN